ncbi:hypothetical protein [Clostridium sp. Cult2]|uniref:hypothetical protein n=1 Tax=Clostridium sp. Cult2 TaxID=2079003 RepID=UPI001F2D3D50|nr:hypothetical protein [Clostridium sp. Cult2]MCF6464848.1 hypothetical protein [Clostridium sp. Cult2]
MSNKKLIGEQLIKTTINFEEALVEILKVEVKRIKKLSKTHIDSEEFKKTNRLINNIVMAFMLTDERIKMGVELYMDNDETYD